MYKIIGADSKEYGPITAEQLRQWIAEGRANLQTQVLPEGATQWTTVGELPEFATTPPPSTAAPYAPSGISAPRPVAGSLDAVNGPAIGLICVAVFGFLAQMAGLVWRLAFAGMAARQMTGPWAFMNSGGIAVGSAIVAILVSVLILFGGLKMKQLENYGLAMTASIVAMIPCISPCCLIGLPIGIWALVVLSKPEVKSAFH
jgi:hypothetical protein